MKTFQCVRFSVVLLGLLVQTAFAQSATIRTYAGLSLPVSGAQATTQAVNPQSAIPDGSGGLFVGSNLNRIYHVAADGVLRVFAGTGTAGFSGDGGPASSAQLSNNIRGIAVDVAGNVFIADMGNSRIRKVAPDGIISTVAGNGNSGFSGDGGPATSAQLNRPSGVAIDSSGNLLIADYFNARIRKVTPSGIISTVAGNGTAGFGGDGGPATSAQLRGPIGVVLDTLGNLLIVDIVDSRIRKVTPAGVISTLAGNGTRGFSGDGGPATAAELSPADIAVDASGNLFIAELVSNRIRKVTSGGVIFTFAGSGTQGFSGDGGPAIVAQLNNPSGVTTDTAGNLFVVDLRNSRIRKVSAGGTISTVVGNGTSGFSGDGGPATAALFDWPKGVAIDAMGNLFVADQRNNRIRKITPSGIISTVAGTGIAGFSGDGGDARSAQLNVPSGVATDTAGNLFVADWGNRRVRKVTPAGIISTIAGNGQSGSGGDGGPATLAPIDFPAGVAVDGAGNVFIADLQNSRVRKVTPAGIISTAAGTGTDGFSGDGGPATSAQLRHPNAIAVDAEGNLFIASDLRIRKVTPAGLISTVAGTGQSGSRGDGGPATSAQFFAVTGMAVDAAGNLFIAEGARIRKLTPEGTISTVAGNETFGFSGDDGPPTSAQLLNPEAVAVDAGGNLYIADSGNHRIRIVKFAP